MADFDPVALLVAVAVVLTFIFIANNTANYK